MSIIGEKIRHLRKRQGLTQKALSERVGIAQASLSELELGTSKAPASGNLLKIAAVLGVEPHILLGHAENGVLLKLDKPRHTEAVVSVEAAIARSGKRIQARSKAKLIAHLYESGGRITESEALRLIDLVE